MNGLDNKLYVTLLIISNLVAILQLIAAIKWPRIARLSFFCYLPGPVGQIGPNHKELRNSILNMRTLPGATGIEILSKVVR
jgi:hypothetical protein